MPTGLIVNISPDAENAVDDAIAQSAAAHQLGIKRIWLPQRVDYDAIALAGLIGAAVSGLGVGTSVVPINPRHPLLVASAAQTAQAASHGNFSLGLGLGARAVERPAFGIDWPDPVGRLREHLSVLRAIFDTAAVDYHGEYLSAAPQWPVRVPGGTPIPIYVAAMGPKALRVTGELADGTMPYLAGPRSIAEFIAPTLAKAAAEAGRPTPKIVAMVPVLVDDDADTARDEVAAALSFYESIPSYQKIIARENVSGPVELAAAGPADAVMRQLQRYLDAGADEVVLSPVGRSDAASVAAVREVAASL